MTKTELKKSHDSLAKFVLHLVRTSDRINVPRSLRAQKNYERALRVLKQAGIKYDLPG